MVELLSPAGSMDALKAAVNAGADAVYFGGGTHNARVNGKNFTGPELEDALSYCRLYGVKSYITLNTLVSGREMEDLLPFLKLLNTHGADGVIVQDLGLGCFIRTCCPNLPLHASTQMVIHDVNGAKAAAKLGFVRAVAARELSVDNLRLLCSQSPIEIEAFIHGALCMCYSGQCYFSSVVGNRSGNQGKCAQPCRLPYQNGYELSLKDLCTAGDFVRFLATGVTSLKIEGRLKSPEYVAGVTGIYRKLIDQRRNATKQELDFLSALFSRQGFTNGYLDAAPSKKMFGTRTEADKARTKSLAVSIPPAAKLPISGSFVMQKNRPMELAIKANQVQVSVTGPLPQPAQNAPTTPADIKKQLYKTGNTPFTVDQLQLTVQDGLFCPVSAINQLRRDGLDALEKTLTTPPSRRFLSPSCPPAVSCKSQPPRAAFHLQAESQLSGISDALEQTEVIWLPLAAITQNQSGKIGAALPRIIQDHEQSRVMRQLEQIRKLGIHRLLCHTVGQILLAKEQGFSPWGSYALNLYNARAIASAQSLGLSHACISWECSLAQIRHMEKPLPSSILLYGRVPLMVTENCIIQNAGPCIHRKGMYSLVDKDKRQFPVLCEPEHRNLILNAVPLYLADKLGEVTDRGLHLSGYDFLFYTETPAQIKELLHRYQIGAPADVPFTRGLYYR